MAVLIPGARPFVEVGGRVFTDLTNIKPLYCYIGTTASSHWSTFREAETSAGYSVPASKRFSAYAVSAVIKSGNATATSFNIGYADNDVGQISTATPTVAVYLMGDSTFPLIAGHPFPASDSADIQRPLRFNIPAAKYPFSVTGNSVLWGIILWGTVESV